MAPSQRKKKQAAARLKLVESSLSFDDKLTRRLPSNEASVRFLGEGVQPLGVKMKNHPLGALITDVIAGKQASEIGLQLGDVLVEVDGDPVRGCMDASELMCAKAADFTLRFYKAADAQELLLRKRQPPKLALLRIFGGASLPPDDLGLDWSEHPLGVRVDSVRVSSPLVQRAGLQEGDVIVTLGGRAVIEVPAARAICAETLRAAPLPLRITYYPAAEASLELALINSSYADSTADAPHTARSSQAARPNGGEKERLPKCSASAKTRTADAPHTARSSQAARPNGGEKERLTKRSASAKTHADATATASAADAAASAADAAASAVDAAASAAANEAAKRTSDELVATEKEAAVQEVATSKAEVRAASRPAVADGTPQAIQAASPPAPPTALPEVLPKAGRAVIVVSPVAPVHTAGVDASERLGKVVPPTLMRDEALVTGAAPVEMRVVKREVKSPAVSTAVMDVDAKRSPSTCKEATPKKGPSRKRHIPKSSLQAEGEAATVGATRPATIKIAVL